MAEWTPPDRSGSRAVLVGTSRYTELTSVPAAANSLESMRRLLTGPLCAWPEGQVTVIAERERTGELPDDLVEIFGQATDVALFYYVGHGQVDSEDQLCLGLVASKTQWDRRATTSLTFEAVRRALRASPAATKIVILDCCYAGHAVHGPHTLAAQDGLDITGLASATGAYTLAATGPASTAWFETDDRPLPHTHFTRCLVDIVTRGIPGEPTGLTLEPIYRRVRETLQAAGKPVPTRSSRDLADAFVFARNVAPRPVVLRIASESPLGDPARRYRLLDDAESAARSIVDVKPQYYALVFLAKEAVSDDPYRARRLAEEIERGLGVVENRAEQAGLLWVTAEAILREDPAWARRLLAAFEQAIASPEISDANRDWSLAQCYGSPELLRLDPDRTERLARAITDPRRLGVFLANAVRSVTVRDLTRAERMARLATDPEDQGSILAALVKTIVDTDADRAERIARTIAHPGYCAIGLTTVAAALASRDPDRARELLVEAKHIGSKGAEATDISRCHRRIVQELAAETRLDRARNNPDDLEWLRAQAARIARAITGHEDAAYAAMSAAEAMLPDKPDEARTLLELAATKCSAIPDNLVHYENAYILRDVARLMLRVDVVRALELARSMQLCIARDQAYVSLAEKFAQFDTVQAELIAHQIALPGYRAPVLAALAAAVVENDPDNASALLDHARRIGRAADLETPGGVARNVAAYDPDLAVKVLTADSDPRSLSSGLARIVEVVAKTDLDRAESIARTIPDPGVQCHSLIQLAHLHRS